ncbi:MAG: cache domain-containing protein, partial [Bacteroidota bacterium]
MKKFHNNIFSLLIFLFITATISILLIMWLNLSDAIEKLAINKLNEITEKTVTKLDAYFDAIRADLLQMKELSDNGMLDAENNMNMNYLLMPVYNTAPQITTFAIARSNGDEFSLIREDSTWLNNFVYETDSGMNIIRERWIGDYMDRIVIRQWEDYNAGYDPRTRDWYKGASALFETSPVYWTNPYKILFQTFPGITAATKAKSKKSGEYNIVQWDILLSDISEFTRQLAFSENGRVFLLSENNEVLGLPADKRFENTDSLRKYVLLHYDSAGYIPMSCAMHSEHEQAKPFPFMINVSAWWGCISKYELDNGRHFLIGVVVPESDFLSDIKRTRNIIFGCSILITIFII